MGEALRERSAATGAAGIRTASGRWLMRTDVDELTHRFGVPAYVLHRADLHQLLIDAAAGADLCIGHRVTGVEGGADGSDTRAGSGIRRADLVVAADGVCTAASGKHCSRTIPAPSTPAT